MSLVANPDSSSAPLGTRTIVRESSARVLLLVSARLPSSMPRPPDQHDLVTAAGNDVDSPGGGAS